MQCLLKDYFEADIDRRSGLHHQGAKFAYLAVSKVIYHKFAQKAASYVFNGETIDVMLELNITYIMNIDNDR